MSYRVRQDIHKDLYEHIRLNNYNIDDLIRLGITVLEAVGDLNNE